MPSFEIMTIGTELLLGHLIDTNSAYVARALADVGGDVFAKSSVGDNAERLEAMLRVSLERCDGVITTGGLGPTVDDLTKNAVARAAGVELEFHDHLLRQIEARFASFGRPMGPNNRQQAYIPRGAVILENPNGTAPGFIALRTDGKFVACMPGVPREMRPMLHDQIIPWLVRKFDLHSAIFTRTLHTIGIGESVLDRRIEDLFRSLENPKIAVLAHEARCDVKIMAKAENRLLADAMIAPIEAQLRERIGEFVFGLDSETIEAAIERKFREHGLTLATAESCTGGSIAERLVSVPGISKIFLGTIVAYSNTAKEELLGVDARLIERFGAVSEEVALAMAQGVRRRFHADVAIATTGIAGPTGGSDEKPVGLVWYGLATPEGASSRRVTFAGDRGDVTRRAAVTALGLLWRYVEARSPAPLGTMQTANS